MNISDYRRENFRQFASSNGGPSVVAKRLGYSNASYVVQMIGPNPTRPVTERMARRIEEEFALPEGTMDKPVATIPLAAAPKAAVVAPAPAEVAAAPMTGKQLGELVQLVGRICETEGATLSTPKFADIVALALTDAAEHGGQAREDMVKTLVRLAR